MASFTDIYRDLFHIIAEPSNSPDPEVQVSAIFTAIAERACDSKNPLNAGCHCQ